MRLKMSLLFIALVYGICLAQAPIIYSVNPDSGEQGQNLSVMISGSGFTTGVSASFGDGITVIAVFYITANFVRVDISIDLHATLGPRDVIVTLPTGAADTLTNGFRVIENDRTPPSATLITPTRYVYMSCPESSIVILLRDENGVDSTSVILRVEGVDYTLESSELQLIGDSLLIFTPSVVFPNGERVDVQLVGLADTIGNAVRPGHPALEFYYRIDTEGPIPSLISPLPGSSTRELQPTVSIEFRDMNSLEHSSVVFSVQGVRYTGDDASVRWRGDTLIWLPGRAAVTFHDGDTVRVCVEQALDRVEFCGPNNIDSTYCWEFYIRVPPPLDINIGIDQVAQSMFPVIRILCEVTDEEGRTISYLNESNFEVYESGVREYPIIVQDLGGGGRVDILFVIDTTGSMSDKIAAIRERVIGFADSLSISGINYRLGLVTFGDGTNFPHGTALTGDVYEFRGWIAALNAAGGGDTPETSLDGIYDALTSLETRPGARIVVIMITDAEPHYRGDGTGFSDVTLDEVINELITRDAICFVVGPDDPNYHGPGSLTDATGGTWYFYNDPFENILASIAEAIRGGYYITYTTHHPVGDCQFREVRVVVNAYGLTDDDVSEYIAPCSPESRILEPLPNTITSNNRQKIRISLADVEGDIDRSIIQLVVAGRVYTGSSPFISFTGDTLVLTPATLFTHRQQVTVNLARLIDAQGNSPISGPLIWRFWVDLQGPVVSGFYPAPETVTLNTSQQIRFNVSDDLSGVDPLSLLVRIESAATDSAWMLTTMSRGVHYDGRAFVFNPDQAGISFGERDTVCVIILRAYDMPDYGEPNNLYGAPYRWCFYIADDDTTCPVFSDFSPTIVSAETPFYIQCRIDDPSGVYDDSTGSGGQGVYLRWDSDGSVDDGTYNELQLDEFADGVFRTVEAIPGQMEGSEFVYVVCAHDNDFDFSDPRDRSFCCSEIQRVRFMNIYGPRAEIVAPMPNTVVADARQPIVVYIVDDENGVNPSTIRLRIEGRLYSVDGSMVVFRNDTLYYFPSSGNLWRDGDSVDVELLSADDSLGNGLQNPLAWGFFVDLTGPRASNPNPRPGEIIDDSCRTISFQLIDRWREVDTSSIVVSISGRQYRVGNPGLHWDRHTHTVLFNPIEAGRCFATAETVIVELVSAFDLPPDYGTANPSEPFRFQFIYYVPPPSFCGDHPDPFTPNGDGYNDIVHFTYPHQERRNCIVRIYTMESELVRSLPRGVAEWDGRDDSGRAVQRGLYLYTISTDGDVVCSGTVLLIR